MNYELRNAERTGIDKILYRQHLERLKNVQPVTDCHFYRPKITPIPRYMDENNRFRQRIDKENAYLLTRLAKVKSGTATHHHMSIIKQLRWNQYLNHVERNNNWKRITQQNQRLLRNIQNVKPCIQLPSIYPSPIARHKRRPKSAGSRLNPNKLQQIQEKWERIRPLESYGLRQITHTNQVTFDSHTSGENNPEIY